MVHSVSVQVSYLRVIGLSGEWRIDLSVLASIRLGEDAFSFKEDDASTELIMRSGDDAATWWIDLPRLNTLTTEGEYSQSLRHPRSITLEGFFITRTSQADMLSLHTVVLNKQYAFDYATTINAKSSSSSPPSFLDITSALQYYLECSFSFTHHYSSNICHI